MWCTDLLRPESHSSSSSSATFLSCSQNIRSWVQENEDVGRSSGPNRRNKLSTLFLAWSNKDRILVGLLRALRFPNATSEDVNHLWQNFEVQTGCFFAQSQLQLKGESLESLCLPVSCRSHHSFLCGAALSPCDGPAGSRRAPLGEGRGCSSKIWNTRCLHLSRMETRAGFLSSDLSGPDG